MQVDINLGLRNYNEAELVLVADFFVLCMTNNHHFTSKEVLERIEKVIVTSNKLRESLKSKSLKTKYEMIKKYRFYLHQDLRKLRNIVENLANNPIHTDEMKELIVQSAGMA
jgi:hypothetical protein